VRRVRVTIVVEEQYLLNIMNVCVCVCVSILVLVIQHAQRMRRIILPSVIRPVLPYFSTFSQNQHDFREKSYWTPNVCFIFSTFVRNTSHSKDEYSEILSSMYIGLHVKYPLFLSGFNETRIVLRVFRKIITYDISWKSVQWKPSCSMRTDRQDDGNSPFSKFCERD
jgi:hypothetical protein